MSTARSWLNAALAFVYPESCQLCGNERASVSEGFVGPECRERVKRIESPYCERCGLPFRGDLTTPFECANCRELKLRFLWARSAVVADGPVLEAIHRCKNIHRALWFEPFLAGLLVSRAAPELRPGEWQCIVPVPLHATREREREFNQAERLAACLAKATGIPLNPRLLRRKNPTLTQTLLSRRDRAENVRGAFEFLPRKRLRGGRLLLVDDVMTTGATTSDCARVLLRAGAAEVCVWTVARGT